jgi:hypothetical protein
MHLVLAATVAELLELETACGRLLVLRRRVVPFLALSALQCNNFPHSQSFQRSEAGARDQIDLASPYSLFSAT